MKAAVASVAVLALLFWAGAADAACETLETTTCTTCTADPTCGWCAPTATCMPGNVTGPFGGRCFGAAWSINVPGGNPCVKCSDITSCRQCVDWSADCEWCGNDGSPTPPYGSCVDLGKNVLGCTKTNQCSCKAFVECSDCNNAKGCGWCPGSDSCVALTDQSCSMFAHTCPCSRYAGCQSCDADPNCVWCTNSSAPGNGQCNQAGPMGGCGSLLTPFSCDAFCQSQGNPACSSCVGLDGCGWCSGINKCKDTAFNHQDCPFVAHTCPIDCNGGTDCTSCNALGGGCQWCENSVDDGKCMPTSSSVCNNWVLDCYPPDNTQTCKTFDGGAFVGGMFTVIGVLILGAAGYFFYRWKMGQRVKYTELGG